MLAGARCVQLLSPVCILPEINSTVSRPLVTYQGELGSAEGLLISMRLLSKYCTRRLPPCPCAYCSMRPAVLGAGPQNQVRLTLPEATGPSVRRHVVSNALPANAGGVNADAAAGRETATLGGFDPWAARRTASKTAARILQVREKRIIQAPLYYCVLRLAYYVRELGFSKYAIRNSPYQLMDASGRATAVSTKSRSTIWG